MLTEICRALRVAELNFKCSSLFAYFKSRETQTQQDKLQFSLLHFHNWLNVDKCRMPSYSQSSKMNI